MNTLSPSPVIRLADRRLVRQVEEQAREIARLNRYCERLEAEAYKTATELRGRIESLEQAARLSPTGR
jgi:hypothetical protein